MGNIQIKNLDNLRGIDFKRLYKLHKLLPENDQMSFDVFKKEFSCQNRHYFFAEIDNNVVGYLGVLDAIDTYEIIGIAVDKNFQNQGVGKELLGSIKKLAEEKGIKLIALEVDVSNKNAIEFYKNSGFQVTNIRKKYYRDNDAYVMHYNL